MRRLRRLRLAILLCVVATLAFLSVFLAKARSDQFAFLNRFHPKRTYLDLQHLATPASRGFPRVREYILEFPDSESEGVLDALRSNLTPRGFAMQDLGAGVRFFPDSKHDRFVSFALSPGRSSLITESAEFQTGRSATYEKMRLIEAVNTGRSMAPSDKVGAATCIVVITTGSTWLQDQVDRIANLFSP